jgi:hypothetical protein
MLEGAMKTWVSVRVPDTALEAELNRLADGGYHIFKIFPVYANTRPEGELAEFIVTAFNTVELMKKLQGAQASGAAALMAALSSGEAKAASGG